ncbi:MAG: hypothetical protein N3B18_03305 [Desulfobacterota bacterium]|nr:hypothetical protein [Thermodesulfobacteriota bacterium]
MDKNDAIVRQFKQHLEQQLRRSGTTAHDFVEILYEYLSQHMSTHFEKTIEGIDTLHSVLKQRQHEHEDILKRLDRIEEQLRQLEQRIGSGY